MTYSRSIGKAVRTRPDNKRNTFPPVMPKVVKATQASRGMSTRVAGGYVQSNIYGHNLGDQPKFHGWGWSSVGRKVARRVLWDQCTGPYGKNHVMPGDIMTQEDDE